MRATMTIAGLYNYDPTIFDYLKLPAGVNKDVIIFHIIEECGFNEILFPNPDYLKESIKNWSYGMQLTWLRFWDAINKEYDPLYNYDRTEQVDETLDGSGNNTEAKTAFNDANFNDTVKNDTSTNSKRNLKSRTFGNVGVITSQQMLEAELNITRQLNFYKAVARDFKEKFCLLVY